MKNKELFYNWKLLCKENEQKIIEVWFDSSKLTEIILKNENSIINQFSNALSFKKKMLVYREYYKCDAVLYYSEDVVNQKDVSDLIKMGGGTYVKCIQIHLEHENDIRTSWQEIIQLCNIPGKFNILVTYPRTLEEEQTVIRVYEKIIKRTKLKKLLIIFGYNYNEEVIWNGYSLSYLKRLKKIL